MVSFTKENNLICNFENQNIISPKDLKKATDKIIYFYDVNPVTAYYLFRIFLSQSVENKLIEQPKYKRFLVKILEKMLEKIPLEVIILIFISLNEYEQVIVGHLLINPYNENNVIYHLINLAIKEKNFEFEIILLEIIKKYHKRICKAIFDIDVFIENLIPIHTIKKKKIFQEEKEVFYMMFSITKKKRIKRKISKIINMIENVQN